MLDRDLALLAQLEQGEEGDRDLDARDMPATSWSKSKRRRWRSSARKRSRNSADRREAQRHVRERRRCGGSTASARSAAASDSASCGASFALRLRGERRRAEAEEPVARLAQPLGEPARGLLHPAVLGEPARELLGRLLRAELGELGLLVGEERAGLQLEQRRDQDEELAARLEVELLPLREPLDERDDDRGDVDLGEVELLAQDERQQQVERPFEGVQVQLELAHDHRGGGYRHGRTQDELVSVAEIRWTAAVAEEILSPELVLVSPPDVAAQARQALPDFERGVAGARRAAAG